MYTAKPLAGRVRSMVGMVCVASQCFFERGMPTNYSSLFTPFLRSAQYDGIFVMDSILNVHGNRHWAQYLAEILYVLYKDTNKHVLAVVCAGASFGKGSYSDMLTVISKVFKKPRFTAWISMGNDLYPRHGYHYTDMQLLSLKVFDVLHRAHDWVPRPVLVFGGSSSLWGWRGYFNDSVCDLHDKNCASMVAELRARDVFCMTGSSIFTEKIIDDRSRQVSADSMDALSWVFHRILLESKRQYMSKLSRSLTQSTV